MSMKYTWRKILAGGTSAGTLLISLREEGWLKILRQASSNNHDVIISRFGSKKKTEMPVVRCCYAVFI